MLEILTWNINGVNFWDSVKVLNPFNNAQPRYPYIKKTIENYNPNILLLQEVVWPGDNSFVSSIEGGYHAFNREVVRSSGLAALTKQKPEDISYTTFKKQAEIFNPKQLGDKFLKKGWQEIDLGDILVINTHLASSYTKEDKACSTIEGQSEQLLKHVRKRKSEGRRLLLGGDFNFRKNSPLYDAFRYELNDMTANLPVKERGYNKVDFIFANFGRLDKAEYVFHPEFRGNYPSDHKGIYVDIDF